MAIVYVVTFTDEYHETCVQGVYTKLELAKEYLLKNYEYWVGSYPDVNQQEYQRGLKDIREVTEEKVIEDSFFVYLDNRGGELVLETIRLDADAELV